MSTVDTGLARLVDRFGGEPSNVLLLAPALDERAEDGCIDLLTRRPTDEHVLYVTFVRSPDQLTDAWQRRMGDQSPRRVGFVDVGDSARSAVAVGVTDSSVGPGLRIETVSSPGDLTDIGIKISGFLQDWEGDAGQSAVCFHSLTTLLQYAELQRVFRFLHVLTGRIRSIDGFAHYHMDPTAHDERDVNTLTTLFDGVAELDGDEWTIRTR